MNPIGGHAKRFALLSAGWIMVGLGTLGIVLPLLPTTCFLLGAGWCFSRSSPRFDRWLGENRLFGRYLTGYRTHGVIPTRVKVVSVSALWGSILLSWLLITPPIWVSTGLLAIAVGVSWHLARLPAPEVAR